LTKQLDSVKRIGVEGITGDHCIVANGGVWHFIENLARVVREGAFGVGVDEGGAGVRVGLRAGSDDMCMELGSSEREREKGARFEKKGESEGVGKE